MAYKARKLELSYEFANAIPTDHPKFKAYQDFRKKFGEDGNLMVIGIQTDKIFEKEIFNDYKILSQQLKKEAKVEDVVALPTAMNLLKDPDSENLYSKLIFRDTLLEQSEIDSCKNIFLNLPFYRNLLYNPESNAWLMGVRIDKEVLASKKREKVVSDISKLANDFGAKHKLEIHLSGLLSSELYWQKELQMKCNGF